MLRGVLISIDGVRSVAFPHIGAQLMLEPESVQSARVLEGNGPSYSPRVQALHAVGKHKYSMAGRHSTTENHREALKPPSKPPPSFMAHSQGLDRSATPGSSHAKHLLPSSLRLSPEAWRSNKDLALKLESGNVQLYRTCLSLQRKEPPSSVVRTVSSRPEASAGTHQRQGGV